MSLNPKTILLTIALIFLLQTQASKVYERCELAKELLDLHELPKEQIGTWVCIARYESEYNTSAINKASGDHGLFQISELFWCSPPGAACGVSCDSLKDDDIEDDVVCARRIYRQHQRLHGNGFLAWVVYNQHCRNAENFVDDCWTKEDNTVTKKGVQDKVKKVVKNEQIVDKVVEEAVAVDAEECNFKSADGKPGKDCKKTKTESVNKGREFRIPFSYEYVNTPTGFKLVKKSS